MRLVAVTRILNEDDIVEAFVRHHAPEIADFIFLDDGSTDRTIDILRHLKNDGFPISVIQAKTLEFDETARNTWLYHYADQNYRPDWVVFLDTDEFIDALEANHSLKDHLATLPSELDLISWSLVNFVVAPDDDPAEVNVQIRLRWRHHIPQNVHKVVVRGGFGQKGQEKGLKVEAGGHGASLFGRRLSVRAEQQFTLGHYPNRSCWQSAYKQAMGWAKVLAAGNTEMSQNRSFHYRGFFELLRDSPARVLLNDEWINPQVDKARFVLRPLDYKGAQLTYTKTQDMRMKAVMVLVHYMEDLARQQGRLVDEVPGVRDQLRVWMNDRKRLI